MRLWWNDSDKGKAKYFEKNALWRHFDQLKILSGPGSNSAFRGQGQVTNRLNHGTAREYGNLNNSYLTENTVYRS